MNILLSLGRYREITYENTEFKSPKAKLYQKNLNPIKEHFVVNTVRKL